MVEGPFGGLQASALLRAFLAESEEMPRNATGKVLHRELKARFSQ